ncbi:MAG: peptidoglycan glycosyltransferase [Eubacterium sp.]|nr:peptidoglycan glycosyltransferase [Eubacterium sp.]
MRTSLFVFFALFFLGFVFLLFRIYLLDKNDGNRYRKAALAGQSYTNSILDFQRGAIRDRNGTTMAVSVRKYNLILEPRTLNNNDEMHVRTVDALSSYFNISRDTIEDIIASKPNSMYEHIDELRELSDEQVDSFREKIASDELIDGIWFEETYSRIYPLKEVGCNVVGFLGSDNQGTYGIEENYNDQLNGTTGREYGYFDSNMNLQRTIKNAKDGNEVILTIDAHVQQVVEQQIRWFQKKSDAGPAKHVGVMLMNPNNGEILAMASESTFDLNNPRTLASMYPLAEISEMTEEEQKQNLMTMWSNFCIGSAYEPGSTFKPFTIAAALDEAVINTSFSANCKGVKNVSGVDIHCNNRDGHGILDLEHILMESCNVGLMNIGAKLGRNKFSKYTKLYGFGQRTGIDLPGETSGLIHPQDKLNAVELATSSFGQTQTVTMVQMLSGFCSLINGGKYYQPHLLKEMRTASGDPVERVEPTIVKTTTSDKTSRTLRKYLKSTVDEGTAKPAAVPGYSVGGKTGTAEKRPVSEHKYLVSFIGAVPIENPQVAIYVIIDEPNVEDQAHSTYATTFASRILQKVLPFLGIYADEAELAKASPTPDPSTGSDVEAEPVQEQSQEPEPEEEAGQDELSQEGQSEEEAGQDEPSQEEQSEEESSQESPGEGETPPEENTEKQQE